ncbi:MAG: hypothetical protein JWR83_957 [Aeromicrobium sp.]|nr:hypothetical protein [Aeromicrobium sp.]
MNSVQELRRRSVLVLALAVAALGSLAVLPAEASTSPRVYGMVRAADGSGPIAGIRVCAESPKGGDRCTTSAVDGTYSIKLRVAPFRYHAFEDSIYGGWVDQKYKNGQIYHIKSTTVHHVNFAMVKGGTISGVLHPPEGGPGIDDTHVTAFRVDSTGRPVESVNLSNVTDSGYYIVSKLPAGTYKLEVDDGRSPGYLNQWYPAQSMASAAEAVTVGVGQAVSGLDIWLTPTGSITIHLAKRNGLPSFGEVGIYDADGRGVAGDIAHGSTHTFVGLHPGDYKVRATPWAVPYVEWYMHKRSFTTANTITVTSGATTEETLTFHYETLKNTSRPTLKVGDVDVTASKGHWSPAPSSNYRYDWIRDGKVIRRGTSAWWYSLSQADVGHRLKVCVTANRSGYASSRSCSSYSAKVKSY